jgi:hypothetical protein
MLSSMSCSSAAFRNIPDVRVLNDRERFCGCLGIVRVSQRDGCGDCFPSPGAVHK